MTSREAPMLVFVFTSVILLFISGVSWPKEAIPPFWKAFGYLFPSTPGIRDLSPKDPAKGSHENSEPPDNPARVTDGQNKKSLEAFITNNFEAFL